MHGRAFSWRVSSLGFCVLAFSAGCASPWTVVQQANPAPYEKSSNMTIEELSFDDLQVGKKTEAQYLATKDEPSQDSFRHDKAAMVSRFISGFDSERGPLPIIPAGIPNSNPFVIKPHVTFIEPGFYSGTIISEPTEVRATIDVVDAQGNVVDEIILAPTVSAATGNEASGTREREAAEELGKQTAAYLKKRVGISP